VGRAARGWERSVVTKSEAELGRVNVAVAPKEERAKDNLGEDVKDTIKDGLAIGGNHVAALGDTPGNRVQDPDSDDQCAASSVDAGDVGTERNGTAASLNHNEVEDVEQSNKAYMELAVALSRTTIGHTDGEVAPLVGGVDKGTDEEGDSCSPVKEDEEKDGSRADSGSQK